MKLFYVMGGGIGHLYRVRGFIDQFELSEFKIVTNNPLAFKLFKQEEILFCTGKDEEELVVQLQSLFHTTDFDELYVDTFPAGLFGELTNSTGVKLNYLARRLKWDAYLPLLGDNKIQFEKTFCFEELETEHASFISSNSDEIVMVELHYPEPNPSQIPIKLIPTGKPIWLVVHSFIIDEVETLLKYAQDCARIEKISPSFVVLTDQRLTDTSASCYTYFPAIDWYPLADRIFTGGGFNAIRQGIPFAEKITAIPFPRKYDDQAWRILDFKKNHSHTLSALAVNLASKPQSRGGAKN